MAVPGVLRVLQLNAGSLIEPGWEARRHEVLAWLDELDPDVVCLQEVWEDAASPNTAGWLVEAAPPGRWHWCFSGGPFPTELWPDPSMRFGVAVLSRWPVDAHEAVPLPGDDGDADPLRRLPFRVLHARTAGLDVFATHLSAAPWHGDLRERQVLALDTVVRSRTEGMAPVPFGVARTAMPPLVCGDFNAEPDSDEIRFLCGLTTIDGRTTFYQDAWRAAGEGPGHTQDWRSNPIAAAMNVHRKRIDYVFVGDPFRREGAAGRVLSAALACHEPRTGVLASDHFGVVVDVAWPTRPA